MGIQSETEDNFMALPQKVWVKPKKILGHDGIFFKWKLSTDKIYHCLEELRVAEAPCPAFYVLNYAVHPFQNRIRVPMVKIVQYLVKMIPYK